MLRGQSWGVAYCLGPRICQSPLEVVSEYSSEGWARAKPTSRSNNEDVHSQDRRHYRPKVISFAHITWQVAYIAPTTNTPVTAIFLLRLNRIDHICGCISISFLQEYWTLGSLFVLGGLAKPG